MGSTPTESRSAASRFGPWAVVAGITLIGLLVVRNAPSDNHTTTLLSVMVVQLITGAVFMRFLGRRRAAGRVSESSIAGDVQQEGSGEGVADAAPQAPAVDVDSLEAPWRERVAALEAERDALVAAQEDAARAGADQADAAHTQLVEEHAANVARVAALEAERESLVAERDAVAQRAESAEADAENRVDAQEYSALVEERSALAARVDSLETERDELTVERSRAETAHAAIVEERDVALRDCEQLRTERDQVQAERETLRGTVDTLNEKVNAIRDIEAERDAALGHSEQFQLELRAAREYGEQLIRERDEARSESRAKSSFLENISYEIRRPLTGIIGYTQWLEEDLADSEGDVVQKLATIREAGNRVHSILDDLMDMTRMDGEGVTHDNLVLDLPEVLTGIQRVMGTRAAAKGLDFRMMLGTAVPKQIHADPMRFRQILVHLVGNAINYTDSGRIGMRVTARDSLIVEVADTGVGMSEELATELLNPLPDSLDAGSDRSMTHCRGLAHARRLAEAMGGEVRLSRTSPQGSIFAVEIPARALEDTPQVETLNTEPEGSSAVTRETMPRLSGRVLLAEDALMIQRLVTESLRRTGLEVTSVTDGVEAMERFDAALANGKPYRLIVTDIEMPGKDGLELTRELRGRGETLPILALTASATDEVHEQAIEAGCSDYLSKPVDRMALIAAVAQHLSAGEAASAESEPTVDCDSAGEPEADAA